MANNTQDFGGFWTTTKLDAIDNYLKFYITALKNQRFNLCYIDAFAGSGKVTINSGEEIYGSALRALKHDFDQFHFFEKEPGHSKTLQERIKQLYPEKYNTNKIQVHNDDCNEFLQQIDQHDWLKNCWRGVIFFDPYAMELPWENLQKIKNTGIFDVWYLFPFNALNRCLQKNAKIQQTTKDKITKLLSTPNWETEIYKKTPQRKLFSDDHVIEKENISSIEKYIISRLETVFGNGVSTKAKLLKNSSNSPLFLLCFACSNNSPKAIVLSKKVSDHILDKI